MWDDPVALDRITRLVLAATLAFALWQGGRQLAEDHLLFRQVEVHGARQPDTVAAVPAQVAALRGGFFSLDLEAARQAFEALPWVRKARVRRLWPDRLRVEIEEHQPTAAWNDLAVLNAHGEVFPVSPWPGLPRVYAPEGSESEVAQRFAEFSRQLSAHGWRIESLRVDARRAWQLIVANGPANGHDFENTSRGMNVLSVPSATTPLWAKAHSSLRSGLPRPWRPAPFGRIPQAGEGSVVSRSRDFHVKTGSAELVVELGRDRLDERLRRFVTFYPLAAAQYDGIRRVDMRYPNGFAVRIQGSTDRNT